MFNSSNISETNGRYAKAQISKSFELPGEEFEPYVAESKNSCWSKALILQYLREHCNNVVHESTRMRPKDDDEVGYKCLQNCCWNTGRKISSLLNDLQFYSNTSRITKQLPPFVAIAQPMEDVVIQVN